MDVVWENDCTMFGTIVLISPQWMGSLHNTSTRLFSILFKIDIVWSVTFCKHNLGHSEHKEWQNQWTQSRIPLHFFSILNAIGRQIIGQSLQIWSRQSRIFGIPVSIASICIPSSCLSLLITFGVELLLPLSSIINEVVMSRFAEK